MRGRGGGEGGKGGGEGGGKEGRGGEGTARCYGLYLRIDRYYSWTGLYHAGLSVTNSRILARPEGKG